MMLNIFHLARELICTKSMENVLNVSKFSLWSWVLHFFLKLFISIASKVDFNCIKAMTIMKLLLTLDADNELASRLKSCFNSFMIQFSSTTVRTTFFSNGTIASFSFSYKKTYKSPSAWKQTSNGQEKTTSFSTNQIIQIRKKKHFLRKLVTLNILYWTITM